MYPIELMSARMETVDSIDAIELCYEKGWCSDGLPVVPPTEEKVQAMLGSVKKAPQEVIGLVPPRRAEATMENVAINAVMAGCLPAYLPVVIAALKAMLEDNFNLHAVQYSTGGWSVMAVVNGPITKELNIHSGTGCLGPGWRANATIGRAIRLILINIGGAIPEIGTQSVLGSPSKYSFCFAEREEASPWEPLHVERGFSPEDSCVTMFSGYSPTYGTNGLPGMARLMSFMWQVEAFGFGELFVILSPSAARALSEAGWSKSDCKRYLYEKARVPMKEFRVRESLGDVLGKTQDGTFRIRHLWEPQWEKWVDSIDDDAMIPAVKSVNRIHIVVAGGVGFNWCAYLWGFPAGGYATTKRIEV